jgi:putative transposase
MLLCRSNQDVILENITLRHQLNIQQRNTKRPRIKYTDRIIFVWISYIWKKWRSSIVVVKPDTVVGWHRKGFKLYWKWKCRKRGRPNINWKLIKLIRKMNKENQLWSAQRIQGELAKLGISVCTNTVKKYMKKTTNESDNLKRQNWITFLRNHSKDIVGIDFCTVPTLSFRQLYVFIAIAHHRSKIIHFNVTYHPTEEWTIQQLRQTFFYDHKFKYLFRDNDKIYSHKLKAAIKSFGLEDTPTAIKSPWQNPYAERIFLTLRHECLDHVIFFNAKHLYKILDEFINDYYNPARTHMLLNKDSPISRNVQIEGKIVSQPILGGLHHIYKRAA